MCDSLRIRGDSVVRLLIHNFILFTMQEEEIVKCHFVPMSTMQKVVDLMENGSKEPLRCCKQNLQELQFNRSSSKCSYNRKKWIKQYQMALSRAVYTHNWNKLLYLLKKSPIWEHQARSIEEFELQIYIRALTILLMNHPSAQAQGLLNDYLHMVLSCRTDQDKKAVLKVILSLPEKILRSNLSLAV